MIPETRVISCSNYFLCCDCYTALRNTSITWDDHDARASATTTTTTTATTNIATTTTTTTATTTGDDHFGGSSTAVDGIN